MTLDGIRHGERESTKIYFSRDAWNECLYFLFSSLLSDNLPKQKFWKFQNLLKRKKGYLKEISNSVKEKSDPSNRRNH